MIMERRKRRSQDPEVALKHWLSAVTSRHNLCGLVLADPSGQLVASSLDKREAAEVAAFMIYLDSWVPEKHDVSTRHAVQVDSLPLYLSAIGHHERSAAAIGEALAGIRRILGHDERGVTEDTQPLEAISSWADA